MRFLVESGTYAIDNVGDIAMLERTVRRLADAFPGAKIAVVTQRPDRLKRILPGVEPVPASPWFRLRVVPVPRRFEYARFVRRIRWREKLLAGWLPRLAHLGKMCDRWSDAEERDAAARFYRAVRSADAVVAAGGGYINDFYHEHAWKVLATLGLAQGMRKPTAMFGIGLGPVSREELVQHGGPILRRLRLLGLREPELSPAEARRLGVPQERIIVTGDDAVAIAAASPAPPAEARRGIGVNLRLSDSAQVPPEALPRVRSAARTAAGRHGATLVPLIVRTADSPRNDVDALESLFGPGGIDLGRAREILTPQQAMEEIARCRVVVTGAYHNAVFALAMGVPVVGLTKSTYYAAKLHGVARQFGGGMSVLLLDDPDLETKLVEEVGRLWYEAPTLHAPLLAAAGRQVALSDEAYERFFQRVDRSRRRQRQ